MSKIIKQKVNNLKRLKKFSEGDLQFLENFKKCNKQAQNFIKDLIKCNPYFWDYGYALDIEYNYFKRLRETLLKENLFIGVERECERIQTCLNLLDIIQGRKGCTRLIFNKDTNIVNLVNNVSKALENSKYEQIKYVNLKNAKRFVSEDLLEYWSNKEKFIAIDSVYEEKAWKLYHNMRINWLRHWWD